VAAKPKVAEEFSFQRDGSEEEQLEELSECSAEVPEENNAAEGAFFAPNHYAEKYHDSGVLLKKR